MQTENEREDAEKIADPADEATRTEMQFTEERIRAASRRTEQKQKPRADGSYAITDCDECGNEIGEARLRVAPNNLHCWHCASMLERGRR